MTSRIGDEPAIFQNLRAMGGPGFGLDTPAVKEDNQVYAYSRVL